MKNVYLLGDDSTRVLSVHGMQDSVHYKQHVGNCFNLSRDGGIVPNNAEVKDFALDIKRLSFMFEVPKDRGDREFVLDNMPSPFDNKQLVDYSEVVYPDGSTFLKGEFNYAIVKDSVTDTVVNYLENEIKIKKTSLERSQLECRMYQNDRDEQHKAKTLLNGRLIGIEARDKKPSFSFVMLIIKNYLKNMFSVK